MFTIIAINCSRPKRTNIFFIAIEQMAMETIAHCSVYGVHVRTARCSVFSIQCLFRLFSTQNNQEYGGKNPRKNRSVYFVNLQCLRVWMKIDNWHLFRIYPWKKTTSLFNLITFFSLFGEKIDCILRRIFNFKEQILDEWGKNS